MIISGMQNEFSQMGVLVGVSQEIGLMIRHCKSLRIQTIGCSGLVAPQLLTRRVVGLVMVF